MCGRHSGIHFTQLPWTGPCQAVGRCSLAAYFSGVPIFAIFVVNLKVKFFPPTNFIIGSMNCTTSSIPIQLGQAVVDGEHGGDVVDGQFPCVGVLCVSLRSRRNGFHFITRQ